MENILYHGSNKRFEEIRKSQAEAGQGISVPDGELLDAVYLTPDFGFAVAMAAKTGGLTEIDDEKHTIVFERTEDFDPDKEVYIYEIDASQIPEENIRYVDERQIAITEMERITPLNVQELKAREILKYHTILDRDGNELFSEFREKDLYQENAKFR